MAAADGEGIPVYKNPDKAIEARVKDLLSRMTLEEKLGQMTQIERGNPGVQEPYRTTFLEAIKTAVGDQTQVIYEEVPSPDTLAEEDFSFAIVAVGEGPYAEFIGDNSELTIPFNGANIISSVADKIPTLVILVSGRSLVLEPWLLEKMEALVAAWLPGSEGAGVTDVVFGDHEFEGALPVSWFKSVDQLPLKSEENSYDPLFPFGFGLKTRKNMTWKLSL